MSQEFEPTVILRASNPATAAALWAYAGALREMGDAPGAHAAEAAARSFAEYRAAKVAEQEVQGQLEREKAAAAKREAANA